MFTASLFIIVKTWKQPKGPLTDDQRKKMWCVYIYIYVYIQREREYYSATKKEALPFAATQVDLERITLSEMSGKET